MSITAKHLRFKNITSNGTYVSLSHFKLKSNGVDVALTGATFTDTAHFDTFAAAGIVNADNSNTATGTFGAALSSNSTVTISLTNAISFDSFEIAGLHSFFSADYVTGFTLEISSDGTTWTTADTQTGLTGWTNQTAKVFTPTFSNVSATTTTTTTTPAPTTTTTTPTDAQIAADKLTVASLKNRVKNGDTLIDDEAIMMKVGDSALVTQIMAALDAGGGYDALRLLGVSDSMAVDILGMYSLKPDATRYEREIGIDAIVQTKTRIKDFLNYLDTNAIAYPPLNGLFSAIRSNNAVYEALRQWNKTRTV